MSYVTVRKGMLGSVALPASQHGRVGPMRVQAKQQHPLNTSHHRMFPLAMVALLAAVLGLNHGVLQQGSGETLVVRYRDGSRTISVPAGVPVTKVEAGSVAIEPGGIAYAVTASSIFVVSAPAPQTRN